MPKLSETTLRVEDTIVDRPSNELIYFFIFQILSPKKKRKPYIKGTQNKNVAMGGSQPKTNQIKDQHNILRVIFSHTQLGHGKGD